MGRASARILHPSTLMGTDGDSVRTHRSLNKDAPVSRPVQRTGVISSRAILGGLHHQYARDRARSVDALPGLGAVAFIPAWRRQP